jgi:SAM-dependent methyltransferase
LTGDLWALQELAGAKRLQDWMFSVVRPTQSGPMLEVGAGIGTFSRRLLDAGASPLLLVEPEDAVADVLERELGRDPRVEIVRELLPDSPSLRSRPRFFRYAVVQNVLEHIEDDVGALRAIADAVEPGGEIVILVPAHPRLYGRLDREFGHFRRYTRGAVRQLVNGGGLELETLRSFNLLGVPGWFVAGRTTAVGISRATLRIYEALLRFWRPVEEALKPPVGLSLVARARKR